jgi:tRNA threonylcarbamoyl adenosine modification protein YjeE
MLAQRGFSLHNGVMEFPQTFALPDLAALSRFAGIIAWALKHTPPRSGSYLITLSGDLGAGKTTFTQQLAKELGVKEVVQSPTFVLAKSYSTSVAWPKRILHVDAYRLEGPKELSAIDWESEIKRGDTIIVLEWPERVEPLSSRPDLSIRFSLSENGGRSAGVSRGSL